MAGWSAVNTVLTKLDVNALAIDPVTPATLYAGIDGGGVYVYAATPGASTFIDSTGAALSTVVTSNTFTVAGLTEPAAISISGGTYSVNGGTYTSSAGTVSNGDTVNVQVMSSSSYAISVDVALTVGGVSDTFSVTTLNDLATPSSTPPSTETTGGGGGGVLDPALLLVALFASYSLARRRNTGAV